MKIKYLGTAAAEGIPAMFCKCDNCNRARALGGKNIRTRSQALIDGKILIDFPADSYMHELRYGIDFSDIPALLITHVHEDHCYLSEMAPGRKHMAKILRQFLLFLLPSGDAGKRSVGSGSRREARPHAVRTNWPHPESLEWRRAFSCRPPAGTVRLKHGAGKAHRRGAAEVRSFR